ncbi:MAG: exonuclease SbcCD subunit D [Victivallales bacterium]|nr:exonuclease SbcCD subunit D [Victivallales bacterium]
MKIFHLSDLHLGKRINGYSMLEDQTYILERILDSVKEEKPQAVIIAGDVYDKAMPSEEAVALLDDFLCKLSALENRPEVFVIYGNHDSAERLSFGNRLIEKSGVHLSPVFNGKVKSVKLTDAHGTVTFHLLPFIKPSDVRNAYPEAQIESYTDAVREAIGHLDLDATKRNVLVAHQFVTDAVRSDSEDVSVGGMDNVNAVAFEGFDYVALGHLHRPQAIPGNEHIRYCGTPLKYSISEKDDKKGILVVEMGAKGDMNYRTIPLLPLHDMREIKGTYDELALKKNYEGSNTEDYIHIVLTDENDIMDAVGRLRVIYPNILSLEYQNKRTSIDTKVEQLKNIEQKTDMEVLEALYKMQNNQELNEAQCVFSEEIFKSIQEGK